MFKKSLKVRVLVLIAVLLTVNCSSPKGYSDLDELYAGFVTALKAVDDNVLEEYCYEIVPDKETVEYMQKNKLSIRGVPDELVKRKMDVSVIGEQYYRKALAFKKLLKQEGKLDDLKYIGREKPGEVLEEHFLPLKIYATETFIRLESKGDTIRCNLGEMYKINNEWKAFTRPLLGY